jgi:hypothetical protein
MEVYVNRVSTRKVDRLVEQLGIEGMTRRQRPCADRARWVSDGGGSLSFLVDSFCGLADRHSMERTARIRRLGRIGVS